jgi:toxin ParE1/3/4
MARQVMWTESAWRDLEEVAEYIAKDSHYYSAAFIREAREAARSLVSLAERGRVVPEFNDTSIRELFVGGHRLIYQVTKQVVYVIGFIHGARDLLSLWQREKQ